MEVKLQHKMSLHLTMTPQLQLAIKLLQLSRIELIDMVREEMLGNPILEDQTDSPDAISAQREAEKQETPSIDQLAAIEERRENAPQNAEEQRAVSESREEEYWEKYLDQYSQQGSMPSSSRASSEDLPSLEATLSSRTSLPEHLLAQIRLMNFTEEEMRFATLVIHNLDDNGYLNLRAIPDDRTQETGKTSKKTKGKRSKNTPEPVTKAPPPTQTHSGSPSARKNTKQTIDNLEDLPADVDILGDVSLDLPANLTDSEGEGSDTHVEPTSHPQANATLTIEDLAKEAGLDPEDAEEVLRMIQQLDPVGVASRDLREALLVQAENFGYDDEDIVWKVIDKHLPNLERRNFVAVARDLKCELEQVYEATRLISTLEPRPGRNFITEDPAYITPDVYVQKVGDEYIVTTNDDGLPKLKVNLQQANALMKNPKVNKDVDAKKFVQDKLTSAKWFMRSLDQRHRTIVKVMRCIVEKQKDFFEKGIEHLKPMILRDIAVAVQMHESTISRVTTNKYVHTPRGIFELKYFFNSSIHRVGQEADIASESVKQEIKKIIAAEDPKNPLSDEQIVKKLEGSKIRIARRTVAKYRDMLGILSSAQRRQYF